MVWRPHQDGHGSPWTREQPVGSLKHSTEPGWGGTDTRAAGISAVLAVTLLSLPKASCLSLLLHKPVVFSASQAWSRHCNLTLTSKLTHSYPSLPPNKVSHSRRWQNAVCHAFPWCQAPVSFQTQLRSCPTYSPDRELLLSPPLQLRAESLWKEHYLIPILV